MPQSSAVAQVLENARETFVFSGYQVVAARGETTQQWHAGITSYWPGATAVTEETYFDIGSVTKAVVTTSLVALAVDQKKLTLDDKIGRWVPEWKGAAVAQLSLADLLSHSSGLKGWTAVYEVCNEGSLRSYVAKEGKSWIHSAPGVAAVYSDLGFLLLGEALKEVFQEDLESAFVNRIKKPLGMDNVQYGPMPPSVPTAATEVRDGTVIQGTVFDENSEALGGKTAHAGLFSNAESLGRWAQEWLKATLGKSSWLSQKTAALFTQSSNRAPGSTWALGWDMKSPTGSSAGTLFSANSFGHLGYPGCSVWIDPKRKGLVVFLSNRVHPSRLDERIRKVRPELHDAIARAWDAGG